MGSGVIREIDEGLERWVASVVGGTVNISLGPPAIAENKSSVGLYLLEVSEIPPASGSKPAPFQIELRYLVTASAPDPKDEHELLEALIFAAMERPETKVDLKPLTSEEWSAFELAPRPSFSMRVPLRKERVLPVAKRVTQELVIKPARLRPLDGLVLGPGDVPLFGAEVELPSTHARARTDLAGKFEFGATPVTEEIELIIRFKGITKRARASTSKPLVIRLDSVEE